METKEASTIQAADTSDSEKGVQRPSSGSDVGQVQEHSREADFWTRNGLNLKSFQRREWGTHEQFDRSMKSRHLNMIAIGGSIGAGFYVTSGSAFTAGGPASVLICFTIAGIMLFNVVYALGELSVMYPVTGGFYIYAVRFIDPSWGTAVGWNYTMQWLIVLPFELLVVSFTMGFWDTGVSLSVWITVFWVFIILVNVFGTLGYAEEEFWASLFKLVSTIIFMIIAVILICGGGPSHGKFSEYWGARLWYDPGAFQNGFRGFCAVFVTAAFSFGGTEIVGLAAPELKDPTKSLPSAIKQVFWRITVFYVLGLTLVGLLISSTDERLLNTQNPYSEGTSPFVLVGVDAGLHGFGTFMNVVILVSVVSIGVSAIYAGSRTLTALAQQGYAPRLFTYIDRSGRPLYSALLMLSFGAIAYLAEASTATEVFAWLLSVSGLCMLFSWGSICYAHIRFRQAWKKQGRSLDDIPFKALFGVWGSWLSLFLIVIFMVAQFFVAIAPPGKSGLNDARGFFRSYLSIFVILLFWALAYLWKRQGFLKLDQIDLDVGMRQHDWEKIHARRAKVASWPRWRRIINTIW